MRLVRLAVLLAAVVVSASSRAAMPALGQAQRDPSPSTAATPSVPATPAPALHTRACVMGRRKLPSLCGSLRVFEDRAARSGRTIDVAFVVLKAKRPTHHAIFFNPGGPGAPAIPLAGYAADGMFEPYMAKLLDRYDVVFVDNRGMGQSRALNCDIWTPAHRAAYFMQLWPTAQLRACRAQLARDANLSLYATDYAVDDIDDIRAALGYPRIALSGGSGGTLLYLDYARRHPSHAESLLLQGVAPEHFLLVPLEDAQGSQMAMDHLVAACAADAKCSRAFPNLGPHFAALVRRFDRGPVAVRFRDQKTKAASTLMLSKEVFADRLRQALYSTDGSRFVPFVIDRAYHDDYGPLATLVDFVTRSLGDEVTPGANLSITCAEDIPFIAERDIVRTSSGSFQGDTRVRAQQRACRIWNVRPVSPAFQQPVRSSAPALLVSGADDPATPPQYARDELPYLSNAKWMLVANASHDTELPCVMRLAAKFIRAASVTGLDTRGCSTANRRPPFATSLPALPM